MAKVYVITKGAYSDYHICAVTLDKEKAERLHELFDSSYDEAEIEEWDTEAPTVDAVEVVHARWEWYEDWGASTWLEPPDLINAGWKCSNCGIDLGDYLTDCLDVNVYADEEDKMPKIKSCPNCGARMDAKEAEHGQES